MKALIANDAHNAIGRGEFCRTAASFVQPSDPLTSAQQQQQQLLYQDWLSQTAVASITDAIHLLANCPQLPAPFLQCFPVSCCHMRNYGTSFVDIWNHLSIIKVSYSWHLTCIRLIRRAWLGESANNGKSKQSFAYWQRGLNKTCIWWRHARFKNSHFYKRKRYSRYVPFYWAFRGNSSRISAAVFPSIFHSFYFQFLALAAPMLA